jgi:hypothetical protein
MGEAALMSELTPRDERRLEKVEEAISVIPVLENEMRNLGSEVHGIKRALWAVAGSIIVAVFTFALAVASGLIGGG